MGTNISAEPIIKPVKILICGDSYCVTDPDFAGLHWSEKLLDFCAEIEVMNFAHGGCSNAMIALQLFQGLRFNPGFVVLSFTNEHRYELDRDRDALPKDLSAAEIANYLKTRYTTNMYMKDKTIERWMSGRCSDNLEKVKNYFYICTCLQTLARQQVPFAFSLGGFEYQQDYSAMINSNYIHNVIQDYTSCELKTNLWFHGQKTKPWFHVDDERVQTLFANECLFHILNSQVEDC